MPANGRIDVLVLQEFRLRAADTAHDVARLLAMSPRGIESDPPLLVSIDDHRDVATVRALHRGETAARHPARAALDALVACWQPVKRYGPRITERSTDPPSDYRLAVTESGINDAPMDRFAPLPRGLGEDGAAVPFGLIWIGAPLGTHAGLLVLLGGYDDRSVRPDPQSWPLPLSTALGVRIYQSSHIV